MINVNRHFKQTSKLQAVCKKLVFIQIATIYFIIEFIQA